MAKPWRIVAVVAIWLGLALASATQTSVALASRGTSAPFADLLFHSVVDWGSCAVFTTLVLWLDARYPAVRRPAIHVPIQLAAIAVLVVAKYALHVAVLELVGASQESLGEALARQFVREAIAF